MDASQRLKLNEMVKGGDVVDQTNLIRHLKHSVLLRNNINTMSEIVKLYKQPLEGKQLDNCRERCALASNWLYEYYTDIFNRILKSNIDMTMLNKFIDILEQIEDGTCDQHDASFKVGTILKEIYIDSALRKNKQMEDALKKEEELKEENEELTFGALPLTEEEKELKRKRKEEEEKKKEMNKKITWSDYKQKKQNEMLKTMFKHQNTLNHQNTLKIITDPNFVDVDMENYDGGPYGCDAPRVIDFNNQRHSRNFKDNA